MESDEFRLEPQTATDATWAQRRLRDHVDRIVALARVPASASDDLHEERYSHRWERWRQALEAGMRLRRRRSRPSPPSATPRRPPASSDPPTTRGST